LPGALESVRAGHVPGGTKSNRQFAEDCVEASPDVPQDVLTLLYDPQTAGGLLIAVSQQDADRLLAELRNAEVDAVEIGETMPKQKPLIAVLP
jgi:selenide,water dikinase